MDQITILWADDEIDLLKPQLLFLEKRGYQVITVTNGYDAIEECENCASRVLELNDALKELSKIRPRHAQVVEMRYFAGMDVELRETAVG